MNELKIQLEYFFNHNYRRKTGVESWLILKPTMRKYDRTRNRTLRPSHYQRNALLISLMRECVNKVIVRDSSGGRASSINEKVSGSIPGSVMFSNCWYQNYSAFYSSFSVIGMDLDINTELFKNATMFPGKPYKLYCFKMAAT